MFVLAIILGIIIGYIFKGKLSNLPTVNLKGTYLIIIGFLIEFITNRLIIGGMLKISIFTFLLDLSMYILIFTFVFLNKKNYLIVIMGIGFLLNAIAIFSNSGTMPVTPKALEIMHVNSVNNKGLYSVVNSNTHFGILCDIFPIHFIRSLFVVSLGDIVSATAIFIFIVKGMRFQSRMQPELTKE